MIEILNYPREQLTFREGEKTSFKLSVQNKSDQYANCRLELALSGIKTDNDLHHQEWYEISPTVSTLTPPKAKSDFVITLKKYPLFVDNIAGVKREFIGETTLTIKAVSIDLKTDEEKSINIRFEPKTSITPLIVDLKKDFFREHCGGELIIPVTITNPSAFTQNSTLRLEISDKIAQWSTQETQIILNSGQTKEYRFTGKINNNFTDIPANIYPFQVTAFYLGSTPSIKEGRIEILPDGYLDFKIPKTTQTIPDKRRWKFWQSLPTKYTLHFLNESNVQQNATLEIQAKDEESRSIECTFTSEPESIPISPQTQGEIELIASLERPWLGLSKTLEYDLTAQWSNVKGLDTRNENKTIKLIVKPIFSIWAVLGGSGLIFFLWLWFFVFNPPTHHKLRVNTVQFNGVGNEVISGSDDQTLKHWQPEGYNQMTPWIRPSLGTIGTTIDPKDSQQAKAIRTLRYRPVDNNWIAVGLENGEIQLWDLTSPEKTPYMTLVEDKSDRILSLTYSMDSRYLFAGYGSGKIRIWDVSPTALLKKQSQLVTPPQKFFDSIYGLTLFGDTGQYLALVGRFNQFRVWNPFANQTQTVNYPQEGGSQDYITSITVAKNNPNRLATGDTAGNIILWDLSDCFNNGNTLCGKVLQQWKGHNNQAIRTVALSNDGCYLATGGNDGKALLWGLNSAGLRTPDKEKVLVKAKGNKPILSVDIQEVKDHILVATGGEDTWVKVKRFPRWNATCDR